MNVKHLPLDQNINGWSAIIPAGRAYEQQRGGSTADWLAIGAGYAGIAFARRLAELRPDKRIILLDAGAIGDNASGRNSGFAIDLPHNIGSSTAELEKAASYRRLLQYGIAHLQETVERHAIACDWSAAGKYHCAVGRGFDPLIEAYVRELNALGEPYQLFDRDELARRLGTRFYRRAVYTPNCILLNPAALVGGLAASLPDNVTVYANSPALNIETGAKIRVTTPLGEIVADRLMLGINGTARGLPLFNGRVFAVATFATLTAPLTPEQRARVGDMADWGLTPANAIAGATLRYTRDHRFLIREHVNFTPGMITTGVESGRRAQHHRAIFARVFPNLRDVAVDYSWSGLISVTRNGAPIWGRLAENVYAAVGCNGAGLSKHTAAGRLLADFALGEDNPLIADAQSLGRASYLPPRPLLDLGVHGYLARERWRARSER